MLEFPGHRCSGAAGAGSALGCWSPRGIGAVVQQGQGVHWGDEGCWSSWGIGVVVQECTGAGSALG